MKTMRILLMGVLLICIQLLVGCGSDKFAGTWYTFVNGEIQQMGIEKNGSNGYIVKFENTSVSVKKNMVNKKEYDDSFKGLPVFGASKKDFVKPIYDYKYEWKTNKGTSYTASEKDGKLYIDGFGAFGVLVYIEKDGILRNNGVVYQKEGKTSLEKMKEAKKDKLKTDWTVNKGNLVYTKVRNVDLFGEVLEINK